MTKKMYISTMIPLSILICFIVVLIFMMTWPCTVLEFKDPNYKVLTPQVKPGDTVIYEAKVTKFKDLPGTVSRQLINSFIYTFTPTIGTLPMGFNDKKVAVELPLYIEPGQYYIHIVYEYKINPFKTIRYQKDTEIFEVIERN